MSGLDIQVEKSKNDSPVHKKIGWRWQNTTIHVLFFPCYWYKPMAKWLRLVAESRATWIWFMMSAETLCSASAILRGTEPVSALTRALVYCCTLQNFLLLGFCQWRSRADRVVNLSMTIRLQLFWRTWARARASTRPHVLAWQMGREYERRSWLTARSVASFFPDFSKKYRKI